MRVFTAKAEDLQHYSGVDSAALKTELVTERWSQRDLPALQFLIQRLGNLWWEIHVHVHVYTCTMYVCMYVYTVVLFSWYFISVGGISNEHVARKIYTCTQLQYTCIRSDEPVLLQTLND